MKSFKKSNIINFHLPRWNELPNIDLYLDQVVCFLDTSLEDYLSKEKSEHIITKTMINNYVKHSVILAPKNKKYNREHIANLFVISILKQLYSISDIAELIKRATENNSLEKAYDKFCYELERAISKTFEREQFTEEKDISFENYVLKNVVFSFANKLYVERIFLQKNSCNYKKM